MCSIASELPQADHCAAMEVGIGTTPMVLRAMMMQKDNHGIGPLPNLRSSLNIEPDHNIKSNFKRVKVVRANRANDYYVPLFT